MLYVKEIPETRMRAGNRFTITDGTAPTTPQHRPAIAYARPTQLLPVIRQV
ncbi:hypothetical protein D3C73_1104040 [compost metagenome]